MKIYQIDCGRIHGIVKSRNESAAFRTLVRRLGGTVDRVGVLARFREITVGHGNRIFVESPWFYIEPRSLLNMKAPRKAPAREGTP